MQLAWDAAVAAFKEFIKAIRQWRADRQRGASGNRRPRDDLDPAEWTREGLILDVRNGDLFEGHYIEHVRRSSNGELIEGRNIWICGGRPSRCERPSNPDKRRHAGTAMIGQERGPTR